jgi:hypothetical protein
MVESLSLLAAVMLLVIVGSHDVAQIFLGEKDTRAYWFKRWIVISIFIGLICWCILIFTGK